MWLVFKKELLELTRDRKTLFFMIALPILIFPLLFGGIALLASKSISDAQEKQLTYSIVRGVADTSLESKLTELESISLVEADTSLSSDDEIKQYVRDGKVDFVVVIPENYSDDVFSSGQIVVRLFLNQAKFSFASSRINEIVDELAEESQARGFEVLNVSDEIKTALLEPIDVERVNVADERESAGAQIGGFIPYFLFILCLQGAMLPAADIGAGEKERGTLETLLLSPIARTHIVIGKFLTISFAGVVSALFTVLSIAVWSIVIGQQLAVEKVSEFLSSIGIVDFLLVFLMLVPIVAIFSSLLLSLSIYARSYKESQGYMTPLVFIVIVPVAIALLPGIELKGIYAWIPLTNVALAIKELIKGTMDYYQLLAIFGSSVILAGALLAFCVHWFQREKVLFR